MRLGYVIHYVGDVAETIAFYERAFGLERGFVHESGDYGQLSTGDTVLAFAAEHLISGQGIAFSPVRSDADAPGMEIGLVTDDLASAYDQAVAAGAVSLQGPVQKPWGQWVAYVRDPNGFLIELCTPIGDG